MFPQNYYFYRMKRQLCTIAMTAMTLVGAAAAGSDSLSRWVNPMIGTNGMGHTFPGACWPFGIVQLSPDTDTVPHNIDGLCGNDDCGQMSAWYIFSAMGFYPVCPGSGEYILGAPYLPYMKINLENGRTLKIKAPKVSDRNRYVRSVSLNGTRLQPGEDGVLKLTIGQILEGGTLEFEMSARH